MGVNFNSQWWKYAISTGNLYPTGICSIFSQMYNTGGIKKIKACSFQL